MAFRGNKPGADSTAGVGAVEDGQVLFAQVRGAFNGLRAADDVRKITDLTRLEAQRLQAVEAEICLGFGRVDASTGEHRCRHAVGIEGKGQLELRGK